MLPQPEPIVTEYQRLRERCAVACRSPIEMSHRGNRRGGPAQRRRAEGAIEKCRDELTSERGQSSDAEIARLESFRDELRDSGKPAKPLNLRRMVTTNQSQIVVGAFRRFGQAVPDECRSRQHRSVRHSLTSIPSCRSLLHEFSTHRCRVACNRHRSHGSRLVVVGYIATLPRAALHDSDRGPGVVDWDCLDLLHSMGIKE